MGLPAAATIAILRYRLYDIDVVINRALVYGVLTALLAATYLVQRPAPAARPRVVHAGLRPGGRRLDPGRRGSVPAGTGPHPGVVDRRFFRRKYDATQTLAVFGAGSGTRSTSTPSERPPRRRHGDHATGHVSLWTPTRGDR